MGNFAEQNWGISASAFTGVPSPRPGELADLARVSLQPQVTFSCLDWFAVDLFVDDSGEVVAVTLDLYEP